jgi:hypothetical protein
LKELLQPCAERSTFRRVFRWVERALFHKEKMINFPRQFQRNSFSHTPKDQLFIVFSDGLKVDLSVVAEISSFNSSEKSAESSSKP